MERSGLSHIQHTILCNMLHFVLMEICQLAWNGQTKQAGDLADLFQNVPLALNKSGYRVFSAMHSGLQYYQAKYHNDGNLCRKTDYIKMLKEIENAE